MKRFLIAALAISSSLLAYTFDEDEKIFGFEAGDSIPFDLKFESELLECMDVDLNISFKKPVFAKIDENDGVYISFDQQNWVLLQEHLMPKSIVYGLGHYDNDGAKAEFEYIAQN